MDNQDNQEVGEPIGEVMNYFVHVKAAAIKLFGDLMPGDIIRIKGGEKDFEQEVKSIEVNRKKVDKAQAGDEVGILVEQDVGKGYKIYKT